MTKSALEIFFREIKSAVDGVNFKKTSRLQPGPKFNSTVEVPFLKMKSSHWAKLNSLKSSLRILKEIFRGLSLNLFLRVTHWSWAESSKTNQSNFNLLASTGNSGLEGGGGF